MSDDVDTQPHPVDTTVDYTLISQDEEGYCGLTTQTTGEAAAREMYDAPCWVDSCNVYRIPDDVLRDDYEGSHYTDILTEDAKDIDEYIISTFNGHLNEIAPSCDDPEHDTCDWIATHAIEGGLEENPGVWGHGGGVKMYTHCSHCDCNRTRMVNTWDTNPCDGSQGHETISYGRMGED